MKKSVLVVMALFFVLILASCTSKPLKKKAVKMNLTLSDVTLNGLSSGDANAMISDFVQDNSSSAESTDIWLSKAWVDDAAALLADEQKTVLADGFRIYFAKDAGDNTIVIVSTKQDVANPKPTSQYSKYYHSDYFDHSASKLSSFLKTSEAIVQEDYSEDPGATLYYDPKCPTTNTCSVEAYNAITCDIANTSVKNFSAQSINIDSEWFPADLLFYLRDELDAAKKTIPADGIRIYFAKYPDIANVKKHKKRHGLIIVTTQNVDGDHQDYYQCYAPGSKWHNLLGANDNGEQCPNNCNGVTLPL